jgi:hypothetical protein
MFDSDGTVKNSSFCFIFESLEYLPNSIIVNTGMPARYVAIVVPLRVECELIWF